MIKPVLSIIIPCYNSGKYLPEALESIKTYPDESVYEVIIVNDGSNNNDTISLLKKLGKEGYLIINQENKGPAAARNAGVKIAKGDYILLLDSDNKVRKDYIYKGIQILNTHPEVSIVHGNSAFFGDTTDPRFYTGKFDMAKLLKGNYIDTCSVIRKTVWEQLNGQDENRLIIAHEDWDFWIRAGAAGYKFYYVDEILFDYRNRSNSLNRQFSDSYIFEPAINYLYCKHSPLIFEHYNNLYQQFYFYQQDQQHPIRSFFKFLYKKYIKKP